MDANGAADSVTGLEATTSKFGSVGTTVWSATDASAADGFSDPLDAGNILLPLGPLPYVYKTYSTVGGNVPTQQSPVVDGVLVSVCPVCTHPAYCVLYDGTTHGLVDIPPRTCVDDADAALGGCLPSDAATDPRHDASVTELTAAGYTGTPTGTERIIPGSTVAPVGTEPAFQGCWQVKIAYAPVMDMCAENPDVVVSDLNPLTGPCSKPQDGFTVYDGLLPRQAGGSHPEAVGWSYESPVPLIHTVPGNSDFRIDEIGDQVLRTRSDPRPLCRYSNCPELTVNGGDQQPESANFLYSEWTAGASWRGDLSSSAQLVFDSTNWDVPQKVTVTARSDDVFEPEVNNRGQDGYVHHFVVAQDINLEHTYYDDIEVNDLTVSITDDDPAVVIENVNEVNPTEGVDAEIKLRLASEPMYPVTVYLQSGSFFTPGQDPACTTADGVTTCNFEPDDEQVIFQDNAQFNTCWDPASTKRTFTYPLVRDQPASYRAGAADLDHGGTFNYQGCFEDEAGAYVLVNAPVDERAVSPRTRQIPATMQCHGDDRCAEKDVTLPNGAYPRDNFYESRESAVGSPACTIVDCNEVASMYDPIGHHVESGQEAGTRDDGVTSTSPVAGTLEDGNEAGIFAERTCKRDGNFLTLRTYSSDADAVSHLPTVGYTCNSYVTFSTTNWDTWQTLDVIGVDDNMDEGEFRISEIGFLYESIDWYYNSAGAKLITQVSNEYATVEDGIAAGEQDTRANTAGIPTVDLSIFDTRFGKHINRYPRVSNLDASAAGVSISTYDSIATVDDVTVEWSIADSAPEDTRGWETGVGGSANVFDTAAGGEPYPWHGRGVGYYSPATWGTPCHGNSGCMRMAPYHGYDAANEVCCCEEVAPATVQDWVIEDTATSAAAASNGACDVDTLLTSDDCLELTLGPNTPSPNTWTPAATQAVQEYVASFGAVVGSAVSAEDPLQVQTFQPEEYANRNVQCGAQVVVIDQDGAGVTISRGDCEATEGRRFWFDTFQQEPTPMECDIAGGLYSLAADGTTIEAPMEVTLGLFTATRLSDGTYSQPSYSRTPATDDSIPSYGTIEGEYSSYCAHEATCTNDAAACTETAADETRFACESVGGVYTPADLQVGLVCYDTTVADEAACAGLRGTWTAADNSFTVNNGLTMAADGTDDAAAFNTINCPSKNADGWTMTDIPDSRYRGMTAPVCPYTIVLDAAPKEGATVVVSLRESFELSNLQDHELFFYEEASYRAGVTLTECTALLYPGSSWQNGGCFIHNIPLDAANMPVPRGSVDLDVMFTDDDWNVPRRITAIALNDDVDEPTEVRTIYHTVGTCVGFNHNNDDACVEDPTFTGVGVQSVDVTVVDDDIADLVVIGDDGYVCAGPTVDGICETAEANVIDESFIGSYDAAGPRLDLTVNFWYQRFERQGPYAEDGISGSNFQGRSQDWTTIVGAAWPLIDPGNDGSADLAGRGAQITNDGIGAGGFLLDSGVPADTNEVESSTEASITGGYITDNEDPLCLDPDPMLQDDRCFRIDDVPWVAYDPYWDVYIGDATGYTVYDSAQPRHVYDACTPTGANDGDADRATDWVTTCLPGQDAHGRTNSKQPNRGFKGIGPAYTEPEDEFAITVHSRECRGDVLGDGAASHGTQVGGADAYRVDESSAEEAGFAEDDGPCVYGTFQVRLNSSPGTKHVRRRYVGEAETVLEEELVQIVVTPDVTPQTMFDPPSVTFTHTGDGDTNRWDEPFRFKVVPVDDEVDERAGVTIDFTSFTITQSHWGDDYWAYTTPYQTESTDGSAMKVLSTTATAAAGRVDTHTPFRHHIRTIHTRDNDYAGVTTENADVAQEADALNGNYVTRTAVTSTVTEGETFSYYTLQLDSQPRKVQRQAGTNPNEPITTTSSGTRIDYDHKIPGGRVQVLDETLYSTVGGACSDDTSLTVAACSAAAETWTFADGADPAGIYHGKHTGMSTGVDCDLEDFSDVTRPAQCGSVEGEQKYWVDVTVTQSIHVDLAQPKSCPVNPLWGGGSAPPTAEHARFPYNANGGAPINELVQTADDLDSYLSTCGGWQRDATYRFTADNWNVPQYVYLYAHNDKDAQTAAGNEAHVDVGGNDATTFDTTLKHYVETQDTLDNMDLVDDVDTETIEGYVQRNKHGAQYTSGNAERYPFGQLSSVQSDTSAHTADTGTTSTDQPIQGVDGMQQPILTEPFGNRETGFSTYGYSDYQWIYGYYEQEHTWTGVHYASTPCGAVHMGAGIGHTALDGTNIGSLYTWDYATTDATDVDTFPIATRDAITGWATGYANPVDAAAAGEICEDPFDNLKPYTQSGAHCVPISQYVGDDTACPRSSIGVTCGAAHEQVAATPDAPNDGTQVDAAYARVEEIRAAPGPNYQGVGPIDGGSLMGTLGAATADNAASLSWTTGNAADGIEAQYCVPKYATKNGGMMHPPADVVVTVLDNDEIADQGEITPCRQTSLFSSTGSNQWLVDENCLNGDAGGLPGYPVTSVDRTDLANQVGAGRRLLMAEGTVLGDAMIPGDDQCANGRTGAHCTECPEGQNVTADGCE